VFFNEYQQGGYDELHRLAFNLPSVRQVCF